MIIYNIDQQSDAWFNIKAGKVSGTSFATLVSGESTAGYKGLLNRLTAEIITEKPDERDQGYSNTMMEESLEMEEDAITEYEYWMGVEVNQVGFVTPDADHEFAEWIGVSPDGLIDNENRIYRGLEIKCPLAKTHIGYIEANKLPIEYRHQVQGSLFVTGLPYWDFMSYYPGMKPFIIRVEPDKELHEQYTERLRKLIKSVSEKLKNYHNYDYLI
jgi:hypothetical protein